MTLKMPTCLACGAMDEKNIPANVKTVLEFEPVPWLCPRCREAIQWARLETKIPRITCD